MNRASFYAALRADHGVFGGALSAAQVSGMEVILDEAEAEQTPLYYLAYMLATAYHETGQKMQPVTELGPRSYFDKYEPGTTIGKALGNVLKGDGYRYRGRGFVQITGRANYGRAAKHVGTDLVAHPERALEPDIATEIMFAGMTEGWFTGKKLGDYFPSSNVVTLTNPPKPPTNYYNARRIINGTDNAARIATYAKAFETALREGAYLAAQPVPKPVQPQQPAPAPQSPPVPESAPTASAGSASVAVGFALVLAFTAAFWTWALDGWRHVIDFIWSLF